MCKFLGPPPFGIWAGFRYFDVLVNCIPDGRVEFIEFVIEGAGVVNNCYFYLFSVVRCVVMVVLD